MIQPTYAPGTVAMSITVRSGVGRNQYPLLPVVEALVNGMCSPFGDLTGHGKSARMLTS